MELVECQKCGKEIDNQNYCPHCGTKNENLFCPSCNCQLEKDNIFCPKCGAKIKKEEDNDVESSKKDSQDESSKNKSSKAADVVDQSDNVNEETISKEYKICPHCKTKISDEDSQYCIECGNSLNIDIQSFDGIKKTIKIKDLFFQSIISIVISVVLSLLFSYIFGFFTQTIDLYPFGFFISLFIVVSIFGSFKDLINGGLLGIITGLVLGVLCNIIVEISVGFQFSYNLFNGYAPIFFTIFGAIIGIISTKYFRKSIVNFIDVEN